MNGRREIMKTKEFYGEKGEQMKVSFEWEKGGNDDFSTVFLLESAEFSEYKMEIVNEYFEIEA